MRRGWCDARRRGGLARKGEAVFKLTIVVVCNVGHFAESDMHSADTLWL